MRIEMLCAIKGQKGKVWGKGEILDDSIKPIPHDLKMEIKLNRGTVRLLGELPDVEKVIKNIPDEDSGPVKVVEKSVMASDHDKLIADMKEAFKQDSKEEIEEKEIIFASRSKIQQAAKPELAAFLGMEDPVEIKNTHRDVMIKRALRVFSGNE